MFQIAHSLPRGSSNTSTTANKSAQTRIDTTVLTLLDALVGGEIFRTDSHANWVAHELAGQLPYPFGPSCAD